MTQDDVIRLWKEANGWDVKDFQNTLDDLMRFTKLVAEHEREACAKICDDKDEIWRKAGLWNPTNEYKECAAAIRARGHVPGARSVVLTTLLQE